MIIVGVCGASGSGKSTLAKRIRDSLSCTCMVIGQDCYYRSFPHLSFEERQHLNYDEPSIFNYDEMLEGIHMFYDKRLCDLMSLKVYLLVDIDICLLRRIRRDIKSRGRTIDNIAEQYVETVKPMYEKYIAKYIDDADFAVMRGGKNRMAIDAISAYLTTKLLAERFDGDAALPKPERNAIDLDEE